MSRIRISNVAIVLAASLTLSAGASAATAAAGLDALPSSTVVIKPYDVFVDPPSRFVFVKLPAGWKFAGALSEAEVRKLPASVLTSLLPNEAELLARP